MPSTEKNLLRWGMKDTLIWECKEKSSGVGLMLCPVSRVTVAGSLLGLLICLSLGSEPHSWCQVWIPSCKLDLKCNQEVICYTQDIRVTFIPLSLSANRAITVLFRVHSSILLINFLFRWCHSTFQHFES